MNSKEKTIKTATAWPLQENYRFHNISGKENLEGDSATDTATVSLQTFNCLVTL